MSELGFRVGMKVEWRYYSTEVEAKQAAAKAIVDARRKLEQGYDFGYQSPGSIRKLHSSKVSGLDPEALGDYEGDVYEVVFP